MSKQIPIHLFREWEQHPITKALGNIFKEIYQDNPAAFLKSITGTQTSDQIALKAAELKGMNKVLEYFFEKDDETDELYIKIRVLDKNVDWEV